MDKAVLKQKAEDSFNGKKVLYKSSTDKCSYTDGFKDGYNKAKEEMNEIGLALQSDMDKTIEQNMELKKQIEKMKCCGNCKSYNMNYLPYYCNKKNKPKHCYEKCEEWEIKENE